MPDDKFMKEFKAVATEELDKQALAGEDLLEQFTEGTISEQDLTKLEAMAAKDKSVSLAMQAFAPMGDEFEDKLTDSLLAMVGGAEPGPHSQPDGQPKSEEKPSIFQWFQNLFQVDSSAFGPALAGAAALAMVAVFYPGTESELGGYSLEVGQGDAVMRGESQKDEGIPTYSKGSRVQLLLRPTAQGDDDFIIRVYLASETEFLALQATTQISSSGAVRISGAAGTVFPLREKPYRVVTILSRFGDTPDESTIRQAAQDGIRTSGEHWQMLSTQIQVK
jgi:hypothetical protein